jgi:hypothetical protein
MKKNRDLSVTKVCECCSAEFNPRYGYQIAARFCSQSCFKKYSNNISKVERKEIPQLKYEVYSPTKNAPPRG